jgi:hypothetical protein
VAGMRYGPRLWRCAMLLVFAGVVSSSPALAQVGYDRPGADYTSVPIRSGDPAVCASRCEHDSRCRAWSFAYPATEGPGAVCWLKNAVPARVENTCCISGVRGAGVVEPRVGAIEYGIDRVGGDYRNLELPADPTGGACAKACEAENKCRA